MLSAVKTALLPLPLCPITKLMSGPIPTSRKLWHMKFVQVIDSMTPLSAGWFFPRVLFRFLSPNWVACRFSSSSSVLLSESLFSWYPGCTSEIRTLFGYKRFQRDTVKRVIGPYIILPQARLCALNVDNLSNLLFLIIFIELRSLPLESRHPQDKRPSIEYVGSCEIMSRQA